MHSSTHKEELQSLTCSDVNMAYIYIYRLPGPELCLLGLFRKHNPFPLESRKLLLGHSQSNFHTPKPLKYFKFQLG